MNKYVFKCYKTGGAVWKRKTIWADTPHEAYMEIDQWCYRNGYADFDLDEE